MYRIMIVEDDPVIAKSVEQQLRAWGCEAQAVEAFDKVLEVFEQTKPHLVLLDISLPFFNGYYWCEQIRRQSKVPIVFLSSTSDNMNIVMAMQMGGDDFVAKPFDLNVLVAKVQAVLRRTYDFGAEHPVLSYGGGVLDLADNHFTYRGQRLELTKNEFRLLELLMQHKGETVSRQSLISGLWETDSFIDDNTLTVNMTRLRKHLEEIGLFDCIVTKKGLGYALCEPALGDHGI